MSNPVAHEVTVSSLIPAPSLFGFTGKESVPGGYDVMSLVSVSHTEVG